MLSLSIPLNGFIDKIDREWAERVRLSIPLNGFMTLIKARP